MMNAMSSGVGIFLSVILTIAGMVLLYLKIVPKKFDGSFGNKPLQMIHDYFNFKKLYLESVLKFLFVLLTVVCIAVGIATIASSFIGIFRSVYYMINYGMPFKYFISSLFSGIFGGVLIMVVGPIVVRLFYEGIMMFIILVKNVIEINNKKEDNPRHEDEVE